MANETHTLLFVIDDEADFESGREAVQGIADFVNAHTPYTVEFVHNSNAHQRYLGCWHDVYGQFLIPAKDTDEIVALARGILVAEMETTLLVCDDEEQPALRDEMQAQIDKALFCLKNGTRIFNPSDSYRFMWTQTGEGAFLTDGGLR